MFYLGWILLLFSCQTEKKMKNLNCDPETGICSPSELSEESSDSLMNVADMKIIYVGDPMCSWCYGIAPELKSLKDHYKAEGIPFEIIVGGLRPGGGDAWTPEFKEFLKHHWEQVNERSGQPFGYKLFERDSFNYDTEPSCRAVVVAKEYLSDDLLAFFEVVQKKFYFDSEDPNEVVFYESICKKFKIPFDEFKVKFESKEMKEATHQEFVLNREWGVSGYPAVVLLTGDEMQYVARGYADFEQMKKTIEGLR